MRKDLFIILSLKHSEGTKPCFWRPDDAGYTLFPWAAGIYEKSQVESNPKYYNNGYDTLAIPLTNDGLGSIGFRCEMNLKDVESLSRSTMITRGKEEKDNV